MSRPLYQDSATYDDLVYGPIVDYEREGDLLEAIFEQHARREVRRVLDLGSGTGGHALVLAERGLEVVGFDLQPAFVARAREKARPLSRPPTFREGDMRHPEVEGPFDAILSLFGAFGHVLRVEASATLRGFRDRLAASGLVTFEFWNPGGARDGYQDWREREADDLRLIRLDRSRLLDEGRTIEIRLKHYVIRGERLDDVFEEAGTLPLYEEGEMEALLHAAGMTRVAMLDWDAKSLGPAEETNFRILAVARHDG